jgi:hypothetical protein
MPLRMLHYVACFYQHLIKTKVTTPAQGLPPILPIVLYNGLERWSAAEDISGQIRPEPPQFLRAYQTQLRYYLIDEGRYTSEQLSAIDSPLSGLIQVEIASSDRASLQAAVDYRRRLREPNQDGCWTLLERLHLIFQREAPEMAYTLQDFIRETNELVIEDALKRDPDAILKRLDPEQRLKGLDPEQRLKGLGPEQRLKGFDPAIIEAWLAKQRRDN